MKRLFLGFILVVAAATALSGCGAFLEDYSYSPAGTSTGGGY